jgi:acetyl esterase/lipase/ABC-type molybdate transport system substrate-binding protein
MCNYAISEHRPGIQRFTAVLLMIAWQVLSTASAQPGVAPGNALYSGEPIGKSLLGPEMAPLELKAVYPNNVEATFDIPYATIPGFREMTLDLYRAPDGPPRPAVVFIHGGSFLTGSPRAPTPLWGRNDRLMAYIAAQGFVLVAIRYRLSSEAKWPAQLEDVKSAVRWLRGNAQKYGVDSAHIGVWGESAGGGVAAMAGTTCGVTEFDAGSNLDQSSCVQAAIDWYGVSDMNQLDAQAPANAILVHNSPDSSQSKVLGCVLHYQCSAEVVGRANPIAYIGPKSSSAAFLIMHGDDDRAVSWKQAQILYAALRAKGIAAYLEIVPGTDHYFVRASQAQAKRILERVVTFLRETLVTSMPSPTSSSQGTDSSRSAAAATSASPVSQKLTDAREGDLRVFATAAFLGPLESVRSQAEGAIGERIVIEYGSARGNLKQKILDGQKFDVALLLPDVDQELLSAGRLASRPQPIARALIGIGILGDRTHLDVGDREGLKQALLGAKSVRYGPTGAAHDTVKKLLDALGIEHSIHDSSTLDPRSRVLLAGDDYELELFPISELGTMRGVRILGPVPAPFQVPAVIEATVAKDTVHREAAQKLVAFLRGPAIQPSLKELGMQRAL